MRFQMLGLFLMDQTREIKVQRSEVGLSDDIAGNIMIESMFLKLKKETERGKPPKKTITRSIPPGTKIDDDVTLALMKTLRDAAFAAFKAVDVAIAIYLQERAPL